MLFYNLQCSVEEQAFLKGAGDVKKYREPELVNLFRGAGKKNLKRLPGAASRAFLEGAGGVK